MKSILIANKNFKDINPCNSGEEYCSEDFSRYNIIFGYHILHYVFKGSGIFNIEGANYEISQGDISIIHPNETSTYFTDRDNPWHYGWIGFTKNINVPMIDQNHKISMPQAEHIFSEICNSDHIEKGREYYLCSKIFELFTLFEQNEPKNEMKEYVLRAKNYIESNYQKPIALDTIAEDLNISKSYFIKTFKKFEAKTPYQYLTEIRINKAIEFLTIHKCSVGETAYFVGYPDIYSFSKAFKNKTGIPPTAYANRLI